MISIVGTIIKMKCTDTEVKSLIRVANGNVLIATNMWVNPNSGQHIVGRKWVIHNEFT